MERDLLVTVEDGVVCGELEGVLVAASQEDDVDEAHCNAAVTFYIGVSKAMQTHGKN